MARREAPALHWCDEHRPKGEGLAKAIAAHDRILQDTDRAIGRLVAYTRLGWTPDAAMRICASMAPIFEAMAARKAEAAEMDEGEEFADRMEARKRRISQEWAADGHRVIWGDSGDADDYELQSIEPQIPGWVRCKTEPQRWDLGPTGISVARIPGDAGYARTYEIRVYTPTGKYTDPIGRHYARVPSTLFLPPSRLKIQVSRWAKRHGLHATGWRVKRSAAESAAPIRPATPEKRTKNDNSVQSTIARRGK